ncbi:MAG: YceD family protein [Pseudomonadota bacterium]
MTAAPGLLIMPALMAHALRDRNTPEILAKSRQVIDFEGFISDFDRLTGIIESDLALLDPAERPAGWRKAPLTARLSFGFADVQEHLPAVTGFARARVSAVCQRCLEPCEIDLDVGLRYLLLPADQATTATDDYEVWELEASSFEPADLVEEALIMALPISASHADRTACGPIAGQLDSGERGVADSTRPFAELKRLMNKTD